MMFPSWRGAFASVLLPRNKTSPWLWSLLSPNPVPTMARNKIIQPGETIGLQLDADDRQAILTLKLARPEIRDIIRQTPESQEIRLTFDQWDELAGRIDGEAHLTDDRGLDRLARKIDRLIEAYFVGEAEPDVGSLSPGWPRQPLESRAASEPSGLPRCRRRGGKLEIGLKLTEHQRRVILDNVPLPKRMRERLASLPGGQQVVELSLKDLDAFQSRMGRAIE